MTAISNLVHQTTASTGAGDLSLSAMSGRQSFNGAFGTGGSDVFFYFISHKSAAEWEVGTGHLADAATLVRDTILASSNGGSAVNFSSGQKDVVNDVPAEYQVIAPLAVDDVTGLQAALDGKAASSHGHADATGSTAGFMPAADKAKLDAIEAGAEVNDVTSVFGRTGAVAAVSGDYDASEVGNDSGVSGADVAAALDALNSGKAASSHTHAISGVTGLQTALDGKAASSHGHAISDVTGLQTALDGKQAGDATLTALAAYSTNGLMTRTGSDNFTGRAITGTANKISVTNGNGVSGNPTITIPDSVQLVTPSIGAATATSVNFGQTSLSHYEEGTWTPTLYGVTTAGTTTYGTQTGFFTRVGRLVHVVFYMSWTNATGTGAARIGGLPFTAGLGTLTRWPFVSAYYHGLALPTNTILVGYVQNGTDYILLLNTGNTTWNDPTDVQAELTTTGDIHGQVIYYV